MGGNEKAGSGGDGRFSFGDRHDRAGADGRTGLRQPFDRPRRFGAVHSDFDGADSGLSQNPGHAVHPIGVEAAQNRDDPRLDHDLRQPGTIHGDDSVTLQPPSTASTWPVTRLEPSPRR